MTWESRLKDAAYTPKGGERLPFLYENVTRNFDKRGTAFEFPDANGTYVQTSGVSGRRYPIRAYFSGANCDLEAEAFEDALAADGAGQLEHPMYGRKTVVALGRVARRDDLKTAANQAIVDVTFWDTIGTTYPTSQDDPTAAVLAADAKTREALQQYFATVFENLKTVAELATLQAQGALYVSEVDTALSPIAKATPTVYQEFQALVKSINADITNRIGDPIAQAGQIVSMIKAPARAAVSIQKRLEGYAQLLRTTIGNALEPVEFSSFELFASAEVYATSYVSACVISVVNNQFETKTGALAAADAVYTLFEEVAAWRENNYVKFDEVDTGSVYQNLAESVALAAGLLVFISFSLKQERSLVLDRSRSIVDLTAQLYGELDESLDFFIASNALTGDEILELPAGKTVLYYV